MKRLLTIILMIWSICTYGQRGFVMPVGTVKPSVSFALIDSATGVSTSTSTPTRSMNFTGANLIVVAVTYQATATGVTVSDNKGNTYTLIRADQNPAYLAWYYCIPTTATTGTVVTISTSLQFNEIWVGAFSGAAASPLDQQAENAGTATSASPGPITTTQNGELIFSAVNWFNNTPAPTVNSGFILISSNILGSDYYAGGCAFLFQPTAGVINETWTATGLATNFITSKITFKHQ